MAESPPAGISVPVMGYLPSMIKKLFDKVSVSTYCSLLCSDRFAPLLNGHQTFSSYHWALTTDRYGKPMLMDANNCEERPITIDEPVEITENVTPGL